MYTIMLASANWTHNAQTLYNKETYFGQQDVECIADYYEVLHSITQLDMTLSRCRQAERDSTTQQTRATPRHADGRHKTCQPVYQLDGPW